MLKKTAYWNTTDYQAIVFSLLRIAVGWHFFWEGWIKLVQPQWTAKGYLLGSWGPLAPLFHGMAELTVENTPILGRLLGERWSDTLWLLGIADFLMPWMLLLAGIGLMLGLMSRTSIRLAMALLVMFIVAMPSYDTAPAVKGLMWSNYYLSLENAQWAGNQAFGAEGVYYLINKNAVELLALAGILTFDTRRLYGLDASIPDRQPTTGKETASGYETTVS